MAVRARALRANNIGVGGIVAGGAAAGIGLGALAVHAGKKRREKAAKEVGLETKNAKCLERNFHVRVDKLVKSLGS
jgi:hypothetical protein